MVKAEKRTETNQSELRRKIWPYPLRCAQKGASKQADGGG
jgi:hypothetical protein